MLGNKNPNLEPEEIKREAGITLSLSAIKCKVSLSWEEKQLLANKDIFAFVVSFRPLHKESNIKLYANGETEKNGQKMAKSATHSESRKI